MKQKGNGIVKIGVALLALIVIGVVIGTLGRIRQVEEAKVDKPALTVEDIAKVVTQAMESRDRIETKKNTDFPVVTPEKQYTDTMMLLNEFGKTINGRIDSTEETDKRLISAIETLSSRLDDVQKKAVDNDSQIMRAVDEVTATLATMKGGERDDALAAAINSLSSRLDKPAPAAAPVPIAVEDGRVNSLTERLARMEERMASRSSAIDSRDLIPVAGGIAPTTEAEELRLSWDRPAGMARGKTLIKVENLRRVDFQPGAPASVGSQELGLIRSAVATAGDSIESGTDILTGTIKGITDVGSGTVKDLTRTAGKTIGGASQVTGDAVGGTADLASKQGKRVWKKIW